MSTPFHLCTRIHTPEKRADFERVFDQMLQAGWLHRFSFTDGNGWNLDWTEAGAARAVRLARIFLSKISDDSLQTIGEFFDQAEQELFLQGDDALWCLEEIISAAGFIDTLRSGG